jgi:hypothetical protein
LFLTFLSAKTLDPASYPIGKKILSEIVCDTY